MCPQWLFTIELFCMEDVDSIHLYVWSCGDDKLVSEVFWLEHIGGLLRHTEIVPLYKLFEHYMYSQLERQKKGNKLI